MLDTVLHKIHAACATGAYADASHAATKRTINRVLAYINGKVTRPTTGTSRRKGKRRRAQDQEQKIKIEKAAIDLCCQYFEKLGYSWVPMGELSV